MQHATSFSTAGFPLTGLLVLLLAACSSTPPPTSTDAETVNDSTVVTDGSAATPDTAEDGSATPADTVATDAQEGSDTAEPDVDETDTAPTDTVEDADDGSAAPDVDETDTPQSDTIESDTDTADTQEQDGSTDTSVDCNYLDLGISIVSCGDGYSYLREWTDLDGNTRACPAYYTISGDTSSWGTASDALASQSCDDSCMYVASTSVSWVRCERRGGYIVYRADGRDCGVLYELPEGLFPSIEAYNEAHPCEEP